MIFFIPPLCAGNFLSRGRTRTRFRLGSGGGGGGSEAKSYPWPRLCRSKGLRRPERPNTGQSRQSAVRKSPRVSRPRQGILFLNSCTPTDHRTWLARPRQGLTSYQTEFRQPLAGHFTVSGTNTFLTSCFNWWAVQDSNLRPAD